MKVFYVLVALVMSACMGMEPPTGAPSVRFTFPDNSVLEQDKKMIEGAVFAWSGLGFTYGGVYDVVEGPTDGLEECPRYWYDGGDGNCAISISLVSDIFKDTRGYIVSGYANQDTRKIGINEKLHSYNFYRVLVHELGHVLLDSEHLDKDQPGVMNPMGGTMITQNDLDLACRQLQICVQL